MGQEEHDGRTVYRHYIPEESGDHDASFSLMPALAGGRADEESPQTTYHLGDELYVIDEETGELIPLADAPEQEGDAIDPSVGEGENPSESFEWGDSNAWGSADWESGSWEPEDTDAQQGGE